MVQKKINSLFSQIFTFSRPMKKTEQKKLAYSSRYVLWTPHQYEGKAQKIIKNISKYKFQAAENASYALRKLSLLVAQISPPIWINVVISPSILNIFSQFFRW